MMVKEGERRYGAVGTLGTGPDGGGVGMEGARPGKQAYIKRAVGRESACAAGML